MSLPRLVNETGGRLDDEAAHGRDGALFTGHQGRISSIADLYPAGERRSPFHIWVPVTGAGQWFVNRVGTGNGLYGYRHVHHPTSAFGTLNPLTYAGLEVWQFRGHGTNFTCVLELDDGGRTGGVQVPGVNAVRVRYLGLSASVDYPWSAANGRYEIINEEVATFLLANYGREVFANVQSL